MADAGKYTAVFADYDESGRLTDVKLSEHNFVRGENTFEVSYDMFLEKNDKIMIWDYSQLVPVCDAYAIK